MEIIDKLDDMGKPAWIGLMVLGFIVFWPIGLGLLAYLIWSGRMGCKGRYGDGGRVGFWRGGRGRGQMEARRAGGRRMRSSGNHAFDEYRDAMIQRLEDEQKEFSDYLERLRMAKDKAEFDQFMADRNRRGNGDPGVGGGDRPTGPDAGPANDPVDVTPRTGPQTA